MAGPLIAGLLDSHKNDLWFLHGQLQPEAASCSCISCKVDIVDVQLCVWAATGNGTPPLLCAKSSKAVLQPGPAAGVLELHFRMHADACLRPERCNSLRAACASACWLSHTPQRVTLPVPAAQPATQGQLNTEACKPWCLHHKPSLQRKLHIAAACLEMTAAHLLVDAVQSLRCFSEPRKLSALQKTPELWPAWARLSHA